MRLPSWVGLRLDQPKVDWTQVAERVRTAYRLVAPKRLAEQIASGGGEKMGSAGSQFYDEDAIFAAYMQHRQHPDNPNDTLEKPVIRELLGAIEGKHILDLGCGDAAIGRELLEQGAATYTGVEGSAKMVAVAVQTLAGTTGQLIHHTIWRPSGR
jgi:2-polyprenyl-3-methyl-5-hydroxy-6-metoxy-1,4-benzoquinol methylase